MLKIQDNAEQVWINKLRRLLAETPKNLWLFAGSGTLYVMRYGIDGNRVMKEHGGMNPDYCIASFVNPEIDGGDW